MNEYWRAGQNHFSWLWRLKTSFLQWHVDTPKERNLSGKSSNSIRRMVKFTLYQPTSTLWSSNIAFEHGPLTVDLPFWTVIFQHRLWNQWVSKQLHHHQRIGVPAKRNHHLGSPKGWCDGFVGLSQVKFVGKNATPYYFDHTWSTNWS